MNRDATRQVHYYDAGSSDAGQQLTVSDESYFAEGLSHKRGHVVLCRAGEIHAIHGTRYMSKPIGYRRDGDDVVVLNGEGLEVRRFDDVAWVVGTEHTTE